MPQRRRYATRDELVALLAEQPEVVSNTTAEAVDAVVDALAGLGIKVDALVKITVDEDVAPDLQ